MFRIVHDVSTGETMQVELTLEEIANLPPDAPSVQDYQFSIQEMVDETARSKLFNDSVTLASYVASTREDWAAQAQVFVAWRDDVWTYCYSELAKVQGGARPQPTIADFLLELPEIVWPPA